MKDEFFSKSLRFEPLGSQNYQKVHEFCEKNVSIISHSLDTFKKATIDSEFFIPDFSMVAIDANDDPIAFFMIVFKNSYVFRKLRNIAVLKFLVVREDWQNKGLGSIIINQLLSRVKNSKFKCFRMRFEVMASSPDYWYPGLDPRHTKAFFFLKKHGFQKRSERINLCVELKSISDNKPPDQFDGFEINRALQEDIEELSSLLFLDKKYRWSFWPEEIRMSFKNTPISTFVARDTNKNDKIVGWATHSVGYPGCFGPTGVSKKLRGKGIGTLLLKWCLWDLKNQEINKCTIRHVHEDTMYFYLKSVGARIDQIYWRMTKRI